jgi:hypothetical protein
METENRVPGEPVVLEIAGLRLPLKPTPAGPLLATDHPLWEPLTRLVNVAVTGGLPQFAQQLAKGQDVVVQSIFAARPQPDDDLAAGCSGLVGMPEMICTL